MNFGQAQALFDAMLAAPYGDTTVGDIVCAETTRNRLESAWLPILEQALTQQRGEQLGDFQDKALAWDAVCDALGSVSPMWGRNGETGLLAAVNTIRSLATTTPQPSADAVRKVIGSMRNFADVADKCELTEGNAQVAIRAWVTQLETLLSGGSHA